MSVERPFDLVLFDLDGTLIDSASQLALAVNRTLTDLGLAEADEAVVRTWVGNGADKLIQRALDYREAPELFARARPLFDQHYQACLLQGLAMYDGVEQSLRRLQALVELDELLHLADHLVSAVEAVERDVALVAAQLDVVLLGAGLHEGGDVAEGEQLELQQHGAQLARLAHDLLHGLVAQLVDVFDHAVGHEAALRVLHVALRRGVRAHRAAPSVW